MTYSIAALPYPLLIKQAQMLDARTDQLTREQPANVFLTLISKFSRAAGKWMRPDRTLAALTDVEAIRSYAAAHDGQLAASLSRITDTPTLDNPRTGKPFNYSVQDDTATLSDTETTDFPLKYTIRVRK
jgi:hypothetical protein